MEKEIVIKIRTALKGGKNLPLRVMINNCYHIFDESKVLQFTLWDDDNGILYGITLPNPENFELGNSKEESICIVATPYEVIEYMEATMVNINDVPDVFNSIRESGKNISDDMEKLILNTYRTIFNSNTPEFSHDYINKLVGSNLSTSDDYYNGKYAESFKETVHTNRYNKTVEELKNKN